MHVLVGKVGKFFRLDRKILDTRSTFFQEELKKFDVKEEGDIVMQLPEVDPVIFSHFMACVYFKLPVT